MPVSSTSLVENYPLGVSSATVRNILSDLEALGLLTHPHTSAGRVPTDAGYRYYVQVLAEEPFAVVVHLPRVNDRSQPQDARLLGRRDAAVVRDQQARQGGHQAAEQERLGEFVGGVHQDENSVAEIADRIVIVIVDPGGAQGLGHEPVDVLAQFFFHRVGPLGGILDVDREDAPVDRERGPRARPQTVPR